MTWGLAASTRLVLVVLACGLAVSAQASRQKPTATATTDTAKEAWTIGVYTKR